jgi:hypothetical protein
LFVWPCCRWAVVVGFGSGTVNLWLFVALML